MPNQNDQGYRITSSGINSQGNHYCHRDYGSSVANRNNYHYSNRDGGYYYQNPDGSKYYNNGRGRSIYTAPNGLQYTSIHNDHLGSDDQATTRGGSSVYSEYSASRNYSPHHRLSPSGNLSDDLQVSTPHRPVNMPYDENVVRWVEGAPSDDTSSSESSSEEEDEEDDGHASHNDKEYEERSDHGVDYGSDFARYDASGDDDGGYDDDVYDDDGSDDDSSDDDSSDEDDYDYY